MNAPNEGSPRRRIARTKTPSPISQGSRDIPRAVAERAVTAALVHWDELERSSLEALAGNDSGDRAKLDLLRSAETWLRGPRVGPNGSTSASNGSERTNGKASSPAPLGPHPTPEDLYDFGRGPGASPLQMERRSVIEDHLTECAICDRAAASLVTTPPVPLLVDKPRLDLPSQIEALPKVDRALLAQICGTKREKPATGAPPLSGFPPSRLLVPTKLEIVRHISAPAPHLIDEAASLPSAAGKSAPSPNPDPSLEVSAEEVASPRGPQPFADSERETPQAPRFRLLSGARTGLHKSAAAAAAALILGVVGINFLGGDNLSADSASLREIASIDLSFPEATIYRGEGDALAHPRERVLSRADHELLPEWANTILFELAGPVEGAESYRFDLYHSAEGGAFSTGVRVATLDSVEPRAILDAKASAALESGNYTWEAWANVNGLDRSLGERDFRIVDGKQTWLTLNEAEKTARTTSWLHEQGFMSDARLQARSLPASTDRDDYLAGSDAPVR